MPFKIFCLLYPDPDPSQHLFSVLLQNDDTVDDLKDAIKLKKANILRDIDADEFTLHQVLIHDDGNLTSELSGEKFESGKVLQPTKKLSSAFLNGAVEDHLNIVALKPSAF